MILLYCARKGIPRSSGRPYVRSFIFFRVDRGANTPISELIGVNVSLLTYFLRRMIMTKQQTCAFIGDGRRISLDMSTRIYQVIDDFIEATDEPIFIVGGINPFERECAKSVIERRPEYRKKKIHLYIVRPDERKTIKWFDSVLICEEAAKYSRNPCKRKRTITQWMINHAGTVISYHNENAKPLKVEYAKEQTIVNVG